MSKKLLCRALVVLLLGTPGVVRADDSTDAKDAKKLAELLGKVDKAYDPNLKDVPDAATPSAKAALADEDGLGDIVSAIRKAYLSNAFTDVTFVRRDLSGFGEGGDANFMETKFTLDGKSHDLALSDVNGARKPVKTGDDAYMAIVEPLARLAQSGAFKEVAADAPLASTAGEGIVVRMKQGDKTYELRQSGLDKLSGDLLALSNAFSGAWAAPDGKAKPAAPERSVSIAGADGKTISLDPKTRKVTLADGTTREAPPVIVDEIADAFDKVSDSLREAPATPDKDAIVVRTDGKTYQIVRDAKNADAFDALAKKLRGLGPSKSAGVTGALKNADR